MLIAMWFVCSVVLLFFMFLIYIICLTDITYPIPKYVIVEFANGDFKIKCYEFRFVPWQYSYTFHSEIRDRKHAEELILHWVSIRIEANKMKQIVSEKKYP